MALVSVSAVRFSAVLCFVLAVYVSNAHASNAVEQQLRDEYKGKTFLLRDFYAGSRLKYDSSGTLLANSNPGDWTATGFVEVKDLHVSGKGITLRGNRLMAGIFELKVFQFLRYEKNKEVEIDAQVNAGDVSLAQAKAVLSKIFLIPDDHLDQVVPGYWKRCFRRALKGGEVVCRFAPGVLAVPGVASSRFASIDPVSEESDADAHSSEVIEYRAGIGIRAPKVIRQSTPSYGETARQARVQGVVVLGLVIDASGAPTLIRIISPLGCGLDEQAIHSVETWKFNPGEKDGSAVAVLIDVEVDFHLY
jgi:TonB family protein